MLDGRYRHALDEIERHLQAEDPDFAARMRMIVQRRPFPVLPVLGAALYITLPLVALLFGPAAAMVAAGLGAVAVAGALIRRRVLAGP